MTNQTVATPGTVIEGKEIQAWITAQAANVTIRNCWIIGPQNTAAGRPLIYHVDAAVKNFHLEHCTVRPTMPIDTTDTILGHDIVRIRNNVSRGVDGSGSFIDPSIGTDCNYLEQGDYVHDLAYFCPSNTHPDNHSHNDGNQQHNGTNVTFEGAAIHGYWDPMLATVACPVAFTPI